MFNVQNHELFPRINLILLAILFPFFDLYKFQLIQQLYKMQKAEGLLMYKKQIVFWLLLAGPAAQLH